MIFMTIDTTVICFIVADEVIKLMNDGVIIAVIVNDEHGLGKLSIGS